MPPARKKPWAGRCQHCLIWWGRDGQLVIGCAHCTFVAKKLDLSATYSEEQLARAVGDSRAGHKRLCKRPILVAA